MKTVILAGGLGTRLSEETDLTQLRRLGMPDSVTLDSLSLLALAYCLQARILSTLTRTAPS